MKWCRISTGIESVQVATDEIVYIRADGNYSDFVLTNGKAERRAIGRINDQLYFIAPRHKETLWDFADALREYGFLDAIYITGGADYVFYRDKDGIRHDIGDPSEYPQKKWKDVIPWLVFKKKIERYG